MRLTDALVGVSLLLYASRAGAVAPIFVETPLRGTPAAARMLELLAQKPPGVDRAAKLTATPSGTYKAIVILLQFPPDPGVPGDPGMLADTLAHPSSAYDSLFFSVGTYPTGSVRDYYREVSRGVFDLEGVVTRWYMAPHHYAYYTNTLSGFGLWPNNAQQMAGDAVLLADQDLDFSQFDNDGPDGVPGSLDDDGIVDAVFVVHAGPGAEETASKSDIYSHKWYLNGSYVSNDGTEVNDYTTEPEKWAGLAPHTSPNELMSVGVFCHEFGHVLTLPDLYDTRNDPAATEGVGEWDLMGSGNFNHRAGETLATSPAHMSAWCKKQLGWITPTDPSVDVTGVTIAPVENGGTVYRLWTDGGLSTEYFLVENRQPIGFDAGLVRRAINIDGEPAHGLLIYHVDDALAGVEGPNDNAAHKLLDVVEAGGAESASGPAGVQNLDVHRNSLVSQSVCGTLASVTGNRGDRQDPWPGALLRSGFNANSCPSSAIYCGDPSQVAVKNIVETAQDIVADLLVTGARVRHGLPLIDDSPSIVPANNGNGMAEAGESVLLRIPLVNQKGVATMPLYAKVASLDSYTTFGAGDSIDYGSIAPLSTQPGTAVLIEIHPSPDPVGAGISYSVFSGAGLVRSETVQVPLGVKLGICDDSEGTSRRWEGVPTNCGSPSEWHRESGANHTTGGSWAWKLGPVGPLGSYADREDARLISQPIRLAGVGDTLAFWQRYGTDGTADGLSVEISLDAGATWTLLQPVGGYSLGDRWSGTENNFVQAMVPLTGYSGVVQLAFRFRSQPPLAGPGWWIDDVFVTGNTGCSTTAAGILEFWAQSRPSGRAVNLWWDLGGSGASSVTIDRAFEGGPRQRIATLANSGSPTGEYEDATVTPGRRYLYWLGAAREGLPGIEYGPIAVEVPVAAPPGLAMGRVSPNPFNPRASVTVTLDRDAPYVLRVFRADGRLVRTIHDGYGVAGPHRFTWDGTDERGAAVGTGIYLFEMRSGGEARVEKAVLLR